MSLDFCLCFDLWTRNLCNNLTRSFIRSHHLFAVSSEGRVGEHGADIVTLHPAMEPIHLKKGVEDVLVSGKKYCRPEFAAKRISGERGREGELDWMTGSICILLQVLVSNTPCLFMTPPLPNFVGDSNSNERSKQALMLLLLSLGDLEFH